MITGFIYLAVSLLPAVIAWGFLKLSNLGSQNTEMSTYNIHLHGHTLPGGKQVKSNDFMYLWGKHWADVETYNDGVKNDAEDAQRKDLTWPQEFDIK